MERDHMTPEQIRSLREYLDLSQAAFAERINEVNPLLRCNRQTVYRWEGGTPARPGRTTTPNAHALAALLTILDTAIRAGYRVDV
jgi:DNA-binding transcriptional regulator YiaG